MTMAWSPIHPVRRIRVSPSGQRPGLTPASPPRGTAMIRRAGLQAAVRDQVVKAREVELRGAPRVALRAVRLAVVRVVAPVVVRVVVQAAAVPGRPEAV